MIASEDESQKWQSYSFLNRILSNRKKGVMLPDHKHLPFPAVYTQLQKCVQENEIR